MNQSIPRTLISQQLSALMEKVEVSRFGITPLQEPVSLEFYRQWLREELHGDMFYLQSHLPMKENPQELLPEAKSAIVVAFDYVPHPEPAELNTSLKIARYARGNDYHFWLKEKLEKLIALLRGEFPEEHFFAATDSKPVLERDLAYRAGLGWFGKNTCLIEQKHGSFFLIGEVLTTLTVPTATAPHPDRCGTCTRCIDACPTQAIIAPRKLDARRCISYLTIESKEVPKEEFREKIGDWFFGCDICQEVCPWNEKVFRDRLQNQRPERESLLKDLKYFLNASNRDMEDRLGSMPLLRSRPFGLRRNAIIVATNMQLKELIPDISRHRDDERLKELVDWSLARLQ